jgi:fringe protein
MVFVFSFFSGGKFISTGEKIRLPDDVTMGYIIGE